MPKCTYCGGTEWFGGPSGGMSQNILCANPKCRHWFNYAQGMMFDDLHMVEPTDEEKAESNRRAIAEREEAFRKRYQEGVSAFERGDYSITLRPVSEYGGATEASYSLDRLCGFLDATAEAVRKRVLLVLKECTDDR